MNDAQREINNLILHRTGFKPGDISVTCPGCGSEVRDKFCIGCGHEVTALSYEVLTMALRRGDITHDELMEGMALIPGFKRRTESFQELTEQILSEQKLLIEG